MTGRSCCARAMVGHTATTPSNLTNSRRLIVAPC
jgi:hypothetical protein